MKPAHTDFTQTQTNRKRKLNPILQADLHRGQTNLGKQPQQDLIRGCGLKPPAGGAAERQRRENLETDFEVQVSAFQPVLKEIKSNEYGFSCN